MSNRSLDALELMRQLGAAIGKSKKVNLKLVVPNENFCWVDVERIVVREDCIRIIPAGLLPEEGEE